MILRVINVYFFRSRQIVRRHHRNSINNAELRLGRILVHDYSGHPFQVQLSRWLAAQGHEVLHLYSASFQTPHGSLSMRADDPQTFQIDTVDVGPPVRKTSLVGRALQDFRYGVALTKAASRFQPQIIVSANTPLDAQARFQTWANDRRIPFVFWLQDVYSEGIANVLAKRLPGKVWTYPESVDG